MDTAAPMAGKSRGYRRWRLVIILLLVLPVVTLLLGNLILSTPWVCRWTAAKIQRHTGGLDTHISGVTFTPWSGISIKGLELLQPLPLRSALKEPLLHINSIRIAPVWHAWLRGKMIVQSMELDTPRVEMPVELLAHLTQAGPTVPETSGPLRVAPPATSLPPATPSVVMPPVVSPPATIAENRGPSFPAILPPPPTGWLHLKNASFSLIHTGSKQVVLGLSGMGGGIPISGNSTKSQLTIGSISILGQQVGSPLCAALDWKSPHLSLSPLEVKIGDYSFVIAAEIGSFSGLPLQIEAKFPPHKLTSLMIPLGGQIEAESISANARFRGLLLSPATWQGDLVAGSTSLSLHLAAHEAKFDQGNAIAILRGGMFSCADARLIGDKLSLLGNATLLADGRLAGAARIVAAPETAAAIARKAFPMMKETPSLTPLSTPQRSAFDLEASGTISQLLLRLGKDGPTVEFKP